MALDHMGRHLALVNECSMLKKDVKYGEIRGECEFVI